MGRAGGRQGDEDRGVGGGQMAAPPSQVIEEGLGHPGFWEDVEVTPALLESYLGAWLGKEGNDCRTLGGVGPGVGLLRYSFNKQMFNEYPLCAKPCAGCWDTAVKGRKILPMRSSYPSWGRGQWKQVEETGTLHQRSEGEECRRAT